MNEPSCGRRRERGAAGRKVCEKVEHDDCRQNLVQPVPDPNYTVRAWRAVVTYLLQR